MSLPAMPAKRAQEIIQAAYDCSTHGPWSDNLDKVMTNEERDQVNEVWQTMPGNTCFVDALYRIARSDGSNWAVLRDPIES